MAQTVPDRRKLVGFTLAELLIALVILGVIATFTIPKLLSNQQDNRKKAIFKESIAAIQETTYALVREGTIQTRSHACSGVTSPIDPLAYSNRLNYLSRTVYSPVLVTYQMANGSRIVVFIGEIMQFDVDYNGPGVGADTYGDDTLQFQFNDCNGDYGAVGPYEQLKPGRFGPMNHLPVGKVAENQALWESIFKN